MRKELEFPYQGKKYVTYNSGEVTAVLAIFR